MKVQNSKSATVPLTKRFLKRSAEKAGKVAAQSAMKTAGYVIKVDNGWLVREEESGLITRIREIEKVNSNLKLD